MEFLKVKGTQITTQKGQPVRLRGFCLGGWMLMENFINGFAGNEFFSHHCQFGCFRQKIIQAIQQVGIKFTGKQCVNFIALQQKRA